MVNLDLTIFLKKVNRGEDLRWVGSRWPLTHALKVNHGILKTHSPARLPNYCVMAEGVGHASATFEFSPNFS